MSGYKIMQSMARVKGNKKKPLPITGGGFSHLITNLNLTIKTTNY